MCTACETFDSEIVIHGPAQLRRLAQKVRDAIAGGVLVPVETAPGGAGPGGAGPDQIPFADLDLDGTLPDVMEYGFQCAACGNRFELSVETYHGQGGTWSKRQPVPGRRL